MEVTLLNLFEKQEDSFYQELSSMVIPRDKERLEFFLKDFFIQKVSFEEYKKELTLGEISMLNSVMKVVALPISLANNNPAVCFSDEDKKDVSSNNTVLDVLDVKTIGTTAVGGFIGGLLFKTWGGVLLSIAGCALGMYLSSSKSKKNTPVNKKLDVNAYIQTLKGICRGIDEIILNYHTSIDNVVKEHENKPKVTLSTAYRPLLERMASMYIAVESENLPTVLKSEFDKLYRTLKNHHYEILNYNNMTKEFYAETSSPHVTKITIVKAAILENGELLERGECLIPEKQ